MDSETSRNNRVLVYSIIFSVSFTVVSLIVGVLTSSQVILFDGIFTLIGVVLTYLSILAMKFIKKKDSWNYPFGKETFEPFIVFGQYCIILLVSIINIVNAIQAILDGGSETNIVSGILYGVFSFGFTLGAFRYLKHLTKQRSTAIEEVEIEQWRFSLLFSLAILVGFSVAGVLSITPWNAYIVFVDPVLTILITLFFIRTAILEIRKCIRELLLATPSEKLNAVIIEKVNQINSGYQFTDMVLRLGKVGEQLVIEIDYVIEGNSELDSICMQDKMRNELSKSLDELPYNKWLNINFVGDIKWAI